MTTNAWQLHQSISKIQYFLIIQYNLFLQYHISNQNIIIVMHLQTTIQEQPKYDKDQPYQTLTLMHQKRKNITQQARHRTPKISQLSRRNQFISKFKQIITNFEIINRLKQFHSLNHQQAQDSISSIGEQLSNKKFLMKLQEMVELQKVLFQIVKKTHYLQFKSTIINIFESICSFSNQSIVRLHNIGFTLFLIEELLRMESTFQELNYLTIIVSFIKNITKNQRGNQKVIIFFINQGYFKLVALKLFCFQNDSDETKQQKIKIARDVSVTIVYFLKNGEINDKFLGECLQFVNDHQKCKIPLIRPQKLCQLYSKIVQSATQQMIVRHPSFRMVLLDISKIIQNCSVNQEKLQILKTLAVLSECLQSQVQQINSISCKFLILCLKSESQDLKAYSVKVLSWTFKEFQQCIQRGSGILELVGEVIVEGLNVCNVWLLDYLYLLLQMCKEGYERRLQYILKQLQGLQKIRFVLDSWQRLSQQNVVCILYVVVGLLQLQQVCFHDKIKRMIVGLNMGQIISVMRNVDSKNVCMLASQLLQLLYDGDQVSQFLL